VAGGTRWIRDWSLDFLVLKPVNTGNAF